MLILLDMHDELVPAKDWSAPPMSNDGFYIFNSASVSSPNKIISQTGAEIVLTSSHRKRFSLEKWPSIFTRRKVFIKSIDRLPESIYRSSRLEEITTWFTTSK